MLYARLTNEWFAKDTSRKVKTALHAKFAAGQRTFTTAPLGYIRHPEIRNTLAVYGSRADCRTAQADEGRDYADFCHTADAI